MGEENILYVLFGSQSKLLKDIKLQKKGTFLRIYNSKRPIKSENCVDVHLTTEFFIQFPEIFNNKKYTSIVFIGAATTPINNKLFISMSKSEIQKSISTNIEDYVDLAYYLLPYMIKVKSGYFIFLSSFASQHTSKGSSLYSASKAFGETFFEVLGKEYGSLGINTLNIRLGCFDGGLFENMDEVSKKKFISSIALKRLGSKKDIENTIDYFINTPYLNSGVIELNGGLNYY